MFEITELGQSIKESEYDEFINELRAQLLLVQQKARQGNDSPVIILNIGR